MRPTAPRTTEFGLFLEAERMQQGLTGKQLADRTGVSPGYISALETGSKLPNDKIIRRLGGALDINPNGLLKAANILVMPLATALIDPKNVSAFTVEVAPEEREQLLAYLEFLRFRASVSHTSFTRS